MEPYIETGNKTLDEMLKSLVTRYPYIQNSFCICMENTPIPTGSECVIVIYGDDSYKAGERHAELCEEYGERYKYIKTPLSVPEFEAALYSLSKHPSNITSAKPSVKYDSTNRTVSKNGLTARLSVKEADLFELLWKKRGTPVSRETLRHQLWQNTDGTNAPDVYVSYLRRKLSPVLGEGALVSIRGKGYMLKDE